MTKHRQLVYGQPIPQDFLDALQEFVGTMGSPNLDLTMVPGSQTQIQIVAGTGSAQVGIAIDGLWRYISAATQTTVPTGAGSAGTYDIFVTTGSNSFATNPSPPPPEIDSTDYSFVLATPLLQGNVPGAAHYRKVGEAVTDGTRVLSLRQTIDVDGATVSQPGDIKMSAAAAPPAGWLLCNGQAVNRNTYAALYAALGGSASPWGQGDGSATFNLPDLRSRAPVGAGQGGGLANRALGAYGGGTLDPSPANAKLGEETHALANSEMPNHSHGGATGGGTTSYVSSDHSHAVNIQSGTESAAHAHTSGTGEDFIVHSLSGSPPGRFQFTASGGYGMNSTGGTAGENTAHSHGVNGQTGGISANHTHTVPALGINADGGSGPHNNMPPWAAVNYFVKT